jgi:hypothetical protein
MEAQSVKRIGNAGFAFGTCKSVEIPADEAELLSKKSAEPQSFCAPIAAISRGILQKWPYLLETRCGWQGTPIAKSLHAVYVSAVAQLVP